MNESTNSVSASPTDGTSSYEGAAEMRHANTQLLQALDEMLGTDSRPESEVDALTAMRSQIQQFLQYGTATGRFIEDTQERTACQVLLDYWASSLTHAGIDLGRPRLVPFLAEALPDLKDKRCPFVGLESIRQPQWLFGRDLAVQSLLQRLQQVPLVVVLGGSGSGKSSLVLAGAMPALQTPKHQPHYRAVGPFTPSNAILEQLLRAVVKARATLTTGEEMGDEPPDDEAREGLDTAVPPNDDLDDLNLPPIGPVPDVARDLSLLRADPGHLARLLGDETGDAPPRPWLVVLDQFEEAFTLCSEADRLCAVAALDALLRAQPQARVLLTLREEFGAELGKLKPLTFYLQQHARFAMKEWSMGYEDLKAAVEGPAQQVNLHFAPGLVDEMVKSVLGQDTALPLLQFALRELWSLRDRNRITRESYRRIGGSPLAALETVATDFYRKLAPEEQIEVRRVLVSLVRINELLEPYRYPCLLSDLLVTGNPRTRRVLGRLRRANLVRITRLPGSTDATVEVKHEALLRNWSLYDEWIGQEREKVRRRMTLTQAAQRWQEAGSSGSEGLLVGWQLEDARRLADLGSLEAQYLQASIAASDRAQRQHKAELHRRALHRAAMATVAVLVVIFLCVQFFLERDARRDSQRQTALTELARAREAAVTGRMDRALLGAVRAHDFSLRTQKDDGDREIHFLALETLATTLSQAADLKRLFVGQTGDAFSAVAFQPKSAEGWLAYGGSLGGKVYLAGLKMPVQRDLPACGETAKVTSLAFNFNGSRLAVGCDNGSVGVWSTADWQRLGPANIPVFSARVWALAFTLDSRSVVVVGQPLHPRMVELDAKTGAPMRVQNPVFIGEAKTGRNSTAGVSVMGGLWALAMSPTGRQFAIGDGAGRVHLCSLDGTAWACPRPATQDEIRQSVPGEAVRALAYSSDGKTLAAGYWLGEVKLWSSDLARVKAQIDVRELDAPVHSLVFFRVCGREQLAVAKGHGILYKPLAAGDDATLPDCGEPRANSVGDETYGLAFDPDTGLLAAATRRAYVAVLDPAARRNAWQAESPALPREPNQPLRAAVVAESASQAWVVVPVPASASQAGNLAVLRISMELDGPGWVSDASPRYWLAGDGLISRVAGQSVQRLLVTLGCIGATTIDDCKNVRDHQVVVWRVNEQTGHLTELRSLRGSDFGGLRPSRIALTPDGNWLAIALEPKTSKLMLVPLNTASSPQTLDTRLKELREIAISDDGRWLAAGGESARPAISGANVDDVMVWSLGTGGATSAPGFPQRVSTDVQKVYELAFAESPARDPQLLVGGVSALDRWDVHGARKLGTTQVDNWPIFQMAFSRTQGLVAAADQRNAVRVWDVNNWSPMELSATGPGTQRPGVLLFDKQGRWLLSGAERLRLWDVDSISLTRKACSLLRQPGQHGADSDIPLWHRDDGCRR